MANGPQWQLRRVCRAAEADAHEITDALRVELKNRYPDMPDDFGWMLAGGFL
jgi:hypothetical protein